VQSQSSNNPSPLSPHFGGPTSHVPSPPPAASGVRRHQSLTYGAAAGAGGGVRHQQSSSGLKRSGTVQVTGVKRQVQATPSPPNGDEEYTYEEEEGQQYEDEPYYHRSSPALQQQQVQGQYPTAQIGRQSPWNNTGNERRGSSFGTGFNNSGNNAAIDDVQLALSALEIASNTYQSNNSNNNNNNFHGGQSAHPPRFNPSHPPPSQAQGIRTPNGGSNGGGGSSRNLQLVTDFDGRKTPLGQSGHPISASAYVPLIGGQQQQQQQQQQRPHDDRSGTWGEKGSLGGRTSNPNLNFGYHQGKAGGSGGIPSVPSIPAQYLNQQQQPGGAPRLGVSTSFVQGQGTPGVAIQQSQQGFINTPIDVPSLIAAKGYNPTNFDVRPSFVSYNSLATNDFSLTTASQRHGSSSLSHILKMMFTNRSNMRFGALPILEIRGLTKHSRSAQVEDLSTCFLVLMRGVYTVTPCVPVC
jgi:YTH domain-containing family protein